MIITTLLSSYYTYTMFLHSQPTLQRRNGNGSRAAITGSLMGSGVRTSQRVQFIIEEVKEIYNISKNWDIKIYKNGQKRQRLYIG